MLVNMILTIENDKKEIQTYLLQNDEVSINVERSGGFTMSCGDILTSKDISIYFHSVREKDFLVKSDDKTTEPKPVTEKIIERFVDF